MAQPLPRYRHFTVDPTKELGDNQEEVWPSMAFVDDDEIDKLRELHAAERDAYRERLDEQTKALQEREESEERPKPSEVVDQPRASDPTPEPEARVRAEQRSKRSRKSEQQQQQQ